MEFKANVILKEFHKFSDICSVTFCNYDIIMRCVCKYIDNNIVYYMCIEIIALPVHSTS